GTAVRRERLPAGHVDRPLDPAAAPRRHRGDRSLRRQRANPRAVRPFRLGLRRRAHLAAHGHEPMRTRTTSFSRVPRMRAPLLAVLAISQLACTTGARPGPESLTPGTRVRAVYAAPGDVVVGT